jgi:hypothetical protein
VLADELSALLDGGRPTVPPAVAAEAIEASNYSIVVLKIDGFAARPDALQTELRRQLYAILPEAAMDAGLDWDSVRRSDRIDGVFLLIPGPPAPSRVLVGLTSGWRSTRTCVCGSVCTPAGRAGMRRVGPGEV